MSVPPAAGDDPGRDDEFWLATNAARRLVSQCRAHVEHVTKRLGERVERAATETPCGTDMARLVDGQHVYAYRHQLKHLESMSNAMLSHLHGLQVLTGHDTFYPLPAMTVARSTAEVASSVVWMLRPGLGPDDRAARAYASLFAVLERGIASADAATSARVKEIREQLVVVVAGETTRTSKVQVLRREKDGVTYDDVAQVRVGKARAKTLFQYSQRMRDEIPRAGNLYAKMSAATHGDHAAVSASFDTPASYARGIGHIALEAAEAWSIAVHTWLGITPGCFWNEADRQNLVSSIPAERRAEFGANLAYVAHDGAAVTDET